MTTRQKCVIVLALVSIGFSAQALNLKEKKQFADWQQQLKDEKSGQGYNFKTNCGYTIPVTLEEKFTTPFMAANANAAAFCDAARSALSGMCLDATAKAEIVKKVKKVTCKLGKEKEKSFKLSGTELVFTVGLGSSNLEESAREYLEKSL